MKGLILDLRFALEDECHSCGITEYSRPNYTRQESALVDAQKLNETEEFKNHKKYFLSINSNRINIITVVKS